MTHCCGMSTGNDLGAGTPGDPGEWTFSTSVLALGSHTIVAVYSGDNNFAGSQSDAQSVQRSRSRARRLRWARRASSVPRMETGTSAAWPRSATRSPAWTGPPSRSRSTGATAGTRRSSPLPPAPSSFSVQHYYDPSTANGTDPYHATVTVTASDRRPPSNTDDIDIAGQSVVTVGVTATPYDPGSGEGGVFTFTRSDSHGALTVKHVRRPW